MRGIQRLGGIRLVHAPFFHQIPTLGLSGWWWIRHVSPHSRLRASKHTPTSVPPSYAAGNSLFPTFVVAASDLEAPLDTPAPFTFPPADTDVPRNAIPVVTARVHGDDRTLPRPSHRSRSLPHNLLLPHHSPTHLPLHLPIPFSHPRPSRSESSVHPLDYSQPLPTGSSPSPSSSLQPYPARRAPPPSPPSFSRYSAVVAHGYAPAILCILCVGGTHSV
ncbi:hypothetical protein C8F01DRAFT_670727 [Mycena amicta]|nr:hypothetical protein C8F01DRAFT_670727 [Mycena amicta]